MLHKMHHVWSTLKHTSLHHGHKLAFVNCNVLSKLQGACLRLVQAAQCLYTA